MLRAERLVEIKIFEKFFMKESEVYLNPEIQKLKEE